jgi:hypothetical protein
MVAIRSNGSRPDGEPIDEKLREQLLEIDELEEDVTTFEGCFIDSVCFKYKGPLSEKQRTVAKEMIERYL